MALLGMAMTLACAGGVGGAGPETTNKPRKHVVVQFTDMSIHPSVARVQPGGNVVWLNYASNYLGAVVFPASIRQGLTCDELRPLFSKVAAGYRSEAITGDMENVTLPCPLKPGSYSYELRLFEEGSGSPDAPDRTLSGRIVVE